jgi:hypothetical protein
MLTTALVVPELTEEITGKILGEKGYISSRLFKELHERGLQLITRLNKKMKNKLMLLSDRIGLWRTAILAQSK